MTTVDLQRNLISGDVTLEPGRYRVEKVYSSDALTHFQFIDDDGEITDVPALDVEEAALGGFILDDEGRPWNPLD